MTRLIVAENYHHFKKIERAILNDGYSYLDVDGKNMIYIKDRAGLVSTLKVHMQWWLFER